MTSKPNPPALTILFLLFLAVFFLPNTSAQHHQPTHSNTPETFTGIGIGINDYGIGISKEKPITGHIWNYGMLGLSTWGFRAAGGITFYPFENGFGHSFSLGYSYAAGMDELETNLELVIFSFRDQVYTDERDVTLNLYAYGTLNFKYAYNIKVGKKSKLVVSSGYSVPLKTDIYYARTALELTQKSKDFIALMAPGGLIIGINFMVGI